MPLKAGLDSAVDTTKLMVTLDGGLIAFVTGTTFLGHITTQPEKLAVAGSVVALGISLFGGILVLLQAGTMYSNQTYDLSPRWIRYPAIANLFGFAIGALCVGALAASSLIFATDSSPAPLPTWHLRCQAAVKANIIDCAGTAPAPAKPIKDD